MSVATRSLVQLIHDTPGQLMLAVAGAGHSALSALLDVAGASRTLLEGLIPYNNAALDDFLAATPAQYVAGSTARLMAGRAYTRARQLAAVEIPVIGVGCTATIATDRTKRGAHRAHVAVRQRDQLVEYYLLLEKGKRSRHDEEAMVGQLLLNAIAHGFGLAEQLDLPLGPGDQLEQNTSDYQTLAAALVTGQCHFIGIQADGTTVIDKTPPVIMSGAFNPLHDGHLEMAEAATALLGQPVTFELAAVNVDKPPLPAAVILARMGQFAGRAAVFASDAPTYLGKAKLYPGATFVVGYDTAVRIFAPRYYDNSEAQMLTALRTIRDLGCHFLVAGRTDADGIFRSLADVVMPTEFRPLFTAIPETLFRRDISSTELRKADARGSR